MARKKNINFNEPAEVKADLHFSLVHLIEKSNKAFLVLRKNQDPEQGRVLKMAKELERIKKILLNV